MADGLVRVGEAANCEWGRVIMRVKTRTAPPTRFARNERSDLPLKGGGQKNERGLLSLTSPLEGEVGALSECAVWGVSRTQSPLAHGAV